MRWLVVGLHSGKLVWELAVFLAVNRYNGAIVRQRPYSQSKVERVCCQGSYFTVTSLHCLPKSVPPQSVTTNPFL